MQDHAHIRLVRAGRHRRGVIAMAAALVGVGGPAEAWILTMKAAPREIYVQVGAGTYTGGNYATSTGSGRTFKKTSGGKPGVNTTIDTVSVTVPAASVGTGTTQQMTSNSAVADSFYDGYATCNPPTEVYVGAWSQEPAGQTGVATLTVTSPANLTSGADTIPFSQISWTSTANGDTTADVAAGTFNGGSVALASIAANTWVEDCLTFTFKNSAIVAAGTYTGQAVYTVSQP
ncbi:MAG TPA: hypothetical protein VFC47_15310 [Caulobacteraceae bacterium]|nr:hypothetical protein [Caulobacteraceae bacterium]